MRVIRWQSNKKKIENKKFIVIFYAENSNLSNKMSKFAA